MNIPDLEALIESIDWDEFQEPSDGNIYFWRDGKIKFAYRIGLHLKRPMEAIMAKGEFVRMRAAPAYGDFELNRLDPDNVDKCLYLHKGVTPHIIVRDGKDWMPKVMKGWAAQQQAMLQAQQALQAQQQTHFGQYQPGQLFSGGGGGGCGTVGLPTTGWTTNTTGGGGNATQAQAQAVTQFQPGHGHYQGLLNGLGGLGEFLGLGGKG